METMYYPITKPIRTTAPTEAQEPVTLDEAKKQCGVAPDLNFHDDDLRRFISAAREQVENDTGIVCYTGEHTWKFSEWPCGDWFEIRAIRPVTAITSITYVDGSGVTQTLSSSNYVLETSTVVPTVRLAYAATWPGDFRGDTNGITVTMTAGYAAGAVPVRVKQAVLLALHAQWLLEAGENPTNQRDAYDRITAGLVRGTYP